jgi:hypothetical protein
LENGKASENRGIHITCHQSPFFEFPIPNPFFEKVFGGAFYHPVRLRLPPLQRRGIFRRFGMCGFMFLQ